MDYKIPNKNIFGNWELFTYDINKYDLGNQKKIPYVNYSNIGFKIQDKGSCNHLSNNNIGKNSSEKLEDTVRQNRDRLTNARTKQ